MEIVGLELVVGVADASDHANYSQGTGGLLWGHFGPSLDTLKAACSLLSAPLKRHGEWSRLSP